MNPTDCIAAAMVADFSHDKRLLRVTWADSHASVFDSLWLRDNCPEDRHPATGQRLVDIVDLPTEPILRSVWQPDDHSFEVSWIDDSRSVRFSADWLRSHCYCSAHRQFRAPIPVLWRGSAASIARLRFPDVLSSPSKRQDWLESLIRYGIAFLSEVPCNQGQVLAVAALAGFVTETNYGKIFDVRPVPDPNHLAYTDAELGLHTDNPYRDPVPGFQFLHCLQSSDEGGESQFVDGFAVAADLKAEDPEAFAILDSTPVSFTFQDTDTFLENARPVIACDLRGQVIAVHYNNRALAPLSIPAGRMLAFYRACRLFSQILREPHYEMRLRLEPGDLVAFHNHRVLHGRTSFQNRNVQRHLQGCYVSQDGVLSALAVLQRNGERIVP
jgi:gamma-butyrobetaine dioxygenase